MRRPFVSAAILSVAAAGLFGRTSAADPDVSAAIASRVRDRAELECLYKPAYAALWVNGAGALTSDGAAAVNLLERAGDDGLDPNDYGANDFQSATSAAAGPAEHLATVDVGISAHVLRYLHDLRDGRLDARSISASTTAGSPRTDLCAFLRAAIADRSLATLADSLRPQCTPYRELRMLLPRYRALAAKHTAIVPSASRAIHPGDAFRAIGNLTSLLEAVGDLAPSTGSTSVVSYSGPVVDGVRAFQRRHGLAPDGVIGHATQAALAVPIARRVRQIELALERTRALCRVEPDRTILVNVPMFRLWAYERDGAVALSQKVIVGRARRTETPRFAAMLRHVIFRPAWNVPASILRGEILPRLVRDPAYLRREHMELVRTDGRAVTDAGALDAVSELRRGTLRLRQRPGPQNALGLIKFEFPNANDVYMHGTPSPSLFAHDRRDFSHGCLRIEDPPALAEWVLNDSADWNRTRIAAAINDTRSQRVAVARPVLVVIFYATAWVLPETGAAAFADDIYGQDALLERALERRPVEP